MEKREYDVIIPEMVEMNKISKKAVANIHNALIQSRHKLSVEEIRLMDTIISFIQPEDEEFKRYKIPVSIFQELYGTQRKDIYGVVKRAVEGLLSKPIKIESLNSKGKKVFEMFNFISYGRYEEGSGCFYVEIDRNFKPYLIELKEFFSRIPIKYTYVLKSTYAIRLYELLKQYENTGFRVDSLPDLREMLGVEPEEYSRFDNFERRVIKPAVKEINEKTDLEVSYTKKRTGRKISHIEFEVKSKNAKIGNTTETTKSPSESIDIQGQKMEKNFNSEDLWKGVLKILEYNYGIHPVDIDFLRDKTRVEYNAKLTPKEIVVFPVEDENLVKGILEEMKPKIDEIVKIETGGTYVFKIGD